MPPIEKQLIHADKLEVVHGSLVETFGEPFSIFTKYVKVFDLYFVATETSDDLKVLHGASVLYQYLDNNDDGKPDNEMVYQKLIEVKALMVMFADEKEMDKNEHILEQIDDLGFTLQDLEADETRPGSTHPEYFDASLEECFHMVTVGYNEAYPEVFGTKRGSKIADAMDKARGGYFPKIPKEYPSNAWFSYYDETCEYCDCMIVEYMYWLKTSILGAQAFRAVQIDDEWRCPTCDSVQEIDPDGYALMTDPQYKFATVCPVKLDRIPTFVPPPKKDCTLL
eukprot:TCONS_00024122-protein